MLSHLNSTYSIDAYADFIEKFKSDIDFMFDTNFKRFQAVTRIREFARGNTHKQGRSYGAVLVRRGAGSLGGHHAGPHRILGGTAFSEEGAALRPQAAGDHLAAAAGGGLGLRQLLQPRGDLLYGLWVSYNRFTLQI